MVDHDNAAAYVATVATPDQGGVALVMLVQDEDAAPEAEVLMANGDCWTVWEQADGRLYGEC